MPIFGLFTHFLLNFRRYHNYLLDLQEIDFLPQNSPSAANSDLLKEALNRLLLRYGLFTESRNITLVLSDPKMHIQGFSSVNCVYSFLEEMANFVFGLKIDENMQIPPEVKEELVRINTLIGNLMEIVGVIK